MTKVEQVFDDDYREPTEDERVARRILALAISLTNARRARSTSELRRDFYPDLGDAAFKKAFRRDRDRLMTTGIVLHEAGRRDRESTWVVDERASFTSEGALSPDDALALDFLLLPLASDPSFPYGRDLRHALNKIDRSFDGTSTASIPAHARQRDSNLTKVEDCLTNHHGALIEYERADGSLVRRTVAPYGLFYMRDCAYLVAARVEGGATAAEPPHTYNLSRLRSLREVRSFSYDIPEDFDIRDYKRLPFQLGPVRYEATFDSPGQAAQSVHAVSDEGAAAAWAIAKGLHPVQPPSLVDEWKRRLRHAAELVVDTDACGAHELPSVTVPPTRPTRIRKTRRGGPSSVRAGRKDGTDRIRELVALLGSLSKTGDSVSLEAIAQRLGISRDEARSLMDIMCSSAGEESCGLLISSNEDETEFTLQYPGVAGRPVRLTLSETIAVYHGLDLCGLADDDPLRMQIHEAFASPGVRMEEIRRALGEGSDVIDKNLLACAWAQVEERVVEFGYQGLKDVTCRTRHALVRHLSRKNDVWYASCHDTDLGQDRTFRLDRMTNVVLKEVRRIPSSSVSSPCYVGVTFLHTTYYSMFEWPGLDVFDEVDGVIHGVIPYYGQCSTWLPQRIAACEGTLIIDDSRIMQEARDYARRCLEQPCNT